MCYYHQFYGHFSFSLWWKAILVKTWCNGSSSESLNMGCQAHTESEASNIKIHEYFLTGWYSTLILEGVKVSFYFPECSDILSNI